MSVPSKGQVKRAGSTLRKSMRGELVQPEKWVNALQTLEEWRRAHATPLVTANNGLRSRARTAEVPAEVTQRLKRMQTILDKLQREPNLDLSRMQDIGGCRAVVADLDDLRRLESRVTDRLKVLRYSDYVVQPRLSGYRGVHVVVEYGERAIEIQLRTGWMHEWALSSEYYSGLLGENLKQDGNHPVQRFLAYAAEIMELQSIGTDVPPGLRKLYEAHRLAALPHVPKGGTQ